MRTGERSRVLLVPAMGKGRRYGTYGETRRYERMRQAGVRGEVRADRGEPEAGAHMAQASDRVVVRPSRRSDEGFIRLLSRISFSRYGSYERILGEWFVSGYALSVTAMRGGRRAGFAMLGMPAHMGYPPNLCEVLAIAVAPENRRHGLGALLMEDMLAKAQQRHAEFLVLHTAVDNTSAQRLFQRHGFMLLDTQRRFYPNGQDAVMMYAYLP